MRRSKFYAVCSPAFEGVLDSWDETRVHVEGVRGAQHKSFRTIEEAHQWLAEKTVGDAGLTPVEGLDQAEQASQPEAAVAIAEAPARPREVEDVDVGLPHSPEMRKRPKVAGREEPRADMGSGAYFVDRVRSVSNEKEARLGQEALSEEQEAVVQVCLAGHNVCITGEAGTGKSHLLRALINRLRIKHNHRGVYCTASTGIAASHIGASTLHQWAGLGIVSEEALNGKKRDAIMETEANKLTYSTNEGITRARERWRDAKVLIIDEISMVSKNFFELLEQCARFVRHSDLPFGGIQLICCGDFLQLGPVKAEFVFTSPVWQECMSVTAQLRTIFRQADHEFQGLLGRLRRGQVCEEDLTLLRRRVDAILLPLSDGIEVTRLYPDNRSVDDYNNAALARLAGQPRTFRSREWCNPARRDAKAILRSTCMAVDELVLKVGAQVILLRNLDTPVLVNGSRGVVECFWPVRNNRPVMCDPERGEVGWPVVRFENTLRVLLSEEEWTYEESDSRTGRMEPLAKLNQVPLRLAWALSIHKSQGMSLAHAEINVGKAFCDGQVYVALSRVKSLAGLRLLDFDAARCRASPQALHYLGGVPQVNLAEWAAREPVLQPLRSIVLGDPIDVDDMAAYVVAPSAPPQAQLCGPVEAQRGCKYGKDCYRKNPQHLAEFSHPD